MKIEILENVPPRHLIFEVDIKYLSTLHERVNDYQMAPELITITPEITGPKQHELRAKYFAAACPYSRKLVCSFHPKKRYVVHGHMLRFYIDRCMKLTKIHRGIKFTANFYFAKYIENNTNKRYQFNKDDVINAFIT